MGHIPLPTTRILVIAHTCLDMRRSSHNHPRIAVDMPALPHKGLGCSLFVVHTHHKAVLLLRIPALFGFEDRQQAPWLGVVAGNSVFDRDRRRSIVVVTLVLCRRGQQLAGELGIVVSVHIVAYMPVAHVVVEERSLVLLR